MARPPTLHPHHAAARKAAPASRKRPSLLKKSWGTPVSAESVAGRRSNGRGNRANLGHKRFFGAPFGHGTDFFNGLGPFRDKQARRPGRMRGRSAPGPVRSPLRSGPRSAGSARSGTAPGQYVAQYTNRPMPAPCSNCHPGNGGRDPSRWETGDRRTWSSCVCEEQRKWYPRDCRFRSYGDWPCC
jgi:hypothetical protein